jgi:tetratricopeptide (TPR) repeat protein
MKKGALFLLGLFICMNIVIGFMPRFAAAAKCEKWAAKAVSVQGTVEVRPEGEAQWFPVKLNDTYCPGDVIRVGERSRADLTLSNQAIVRLDEGCSIVLGGLRDERTSLVSLLDGAFYFFSRVVKGLEIHTTFVNAGVEGTEGLVKVEDNSTFILIIEGKVLASNDAGSMRLTSGEAALTEEGKAPEQKTVVRPWDSVQWAIYYPPLIYYRPADFAGHPEGDWRTKVRKSLEAYWAGDIAEAFSQIEGVPENVGDTHFFIYRASLLLTVGRVDEVSEDLQRILDLDPNNSSALALQSTIAVATNENKKALDQANRAVEADPESAAAKVALSYAQQSNFDLDGALDSLKEAVALDPENALAWARLAELWQSFGRLDKALESAEKAAALNPNLARTQTVLGYAYLSQVKTRAAKDAFEKAIVLNQADPLPRLGLGLAKIREGNLEEGIGEIEVAASLDPDNAIVRSYLGKAYFEEKRDGFVENQFDMAKSLDPLDPTAYFYDAIEKQTTNRPVEALHDMQEAIELNDNRAVYRSRLLLDEDLAARSASLARIYNDLGFEQLALVEGWKSVNTAPDNYSAHRFLADSYSALPRHEIARVSELLQSQLLQPINITPVQPHLAEGNLFVVSGGGPADLSFNEFNPLFLRDRFGLQVSGIVGENGTFGNEVTVSGLYKKASLSVGQYHFETNGFRVNNDLKDDIYNAFLQMELSHKTSIQVEIRRRETERGDLPLRFFTNPYPFFQSGFLPGFREEEQTSSVRLGFHHAFSPGSDLIGNFMYQDVDYLQSLTIDDPFGPLREVAKIGGGDEDALGGEVQYLFSSKYVKVTSGVGHFEIDTEDVRTDDLFDTTPPPPPDLIDSIYNLIYGTGADHADVEVDTHHTNVYVYSYINYLQNVTFTVGGSFDSFESESVTRILGVPDNREVVDKDQFNPKFGIIWNLTPDTTVRAAIFRTLKRRLITNQTLEPTQVAGFNQFYDDGNATDAWRYGAAVDQKFSKDIYGGVEYSIRDLNDIPFANFVTGEMDKADWDEKLARAYLYWTPHDWLALRAEYQFEKFDRDINFNLNVKKVKTHRVPLGVSFYHPSGLSAGLQATYYNQEGDFETLEALSGVFTHGEDQFWLVDASISYRLPKRRGFITVGAKNLFDKDFRYFDTGVGTTIQNPTIQPTRTVYTRLTLSL